MESRRSFIGKVGAVAASAAILAVAKPAKAEIPADHRGYFKAAQRDLPDGCHVYLDGKKIDAVCSEFDTDNGWARCYLDYEGTPSHPISLGHEWWYDAHGIEVRPWLAPDGSSSYTKLENGKGGRTLIRTYPRPETEAYRLESMGWKCELRQHYLYGKVEVR